MEWQLIETAPKDGKRTPILIWHPEVGVMAPKHAEWWTWEKKATHWMPEPPPPPAP